MKRFRIIVPLGLAGIAAVAATAALAAASPFTATYTGKVTEKVSGQNITASATGKGTGTIVKSSTVAGVVHATTANPPCSPFNGPASIKSGMGMLKLNVLPISRGCAAGEDDRDHITLSGSAKVVGGTGKFKSAKGTLRFSGQYDRGKGTFAVKLRGSLSY